MSDKSQGTVALGICRCGHANTQHVKRNGVCTECARDAMDGDPRGLRCGQYTWRQWTPEGKAVVATKTLARSTT